MSQIFGSDITLPRDPVSPLQAATKQYVDGGLEAKADTEHIHNGTLTVETIGVLFSRYFDTVAPLYTEEMTPLYTWHEEDIGVTASTAMVNWGAFTVVENALFAPGACLFAMTPSQLRVARMGYQEGFFLTSLLGTSALDNLTAFYSIPRLLRQLHDGTLAITTHRLTNGYTFDNIKVDSAISLVKRVTLSSSCYFYDVVQSEDDPTRIILLGCDSSGAAVYRCTSLANPVKSSISSQ